MTFLSGGYTHRCGLPNAYDVTPGSVYACDCGRRWQRSPGSWEPYWADWDAPVRSLLPRGWPDRFHLRRRPRRAKVTP